MLTLPTDRPIHPIVLQPAMVRATQTSAKTVTRRICTEAWFVGEGWAATFHPAAVQGFVFWSNAGDLVPGVDLAVWTKQQYQHGVISRYGIQGDYLWVRERWACVDGTYHYQADYDPAIAVPWRWRTPWYLPRHASRLLLQTTTTPFPQRIQQMTEADAQVEGVSSLTAFIAQWDAMHAQPKPRKQGAYYVSYPFADIQEVRTHRGRHWYVCGNPWVWVIPFVDVTHRFTTARTSPCAV